MSFQIKVSAAHFFNEPKVGAVAPHLDLSAHWAKPLPALGPSAAFAKSNFNGMHLTSAPSTSLPQAVTHTASLNAHVDAIGKVFERRYQDLKRSVMENMALASYAMPLTMLMPEQRLPKELINARQDLHQTLETWAQASRLGMQVLDQFHPLQIVHSVVSPNAQQSSVFSNVKHVGAAMGDYVSARAKQWLNSENKLTPGLSAGVVDALLGTALLATTRKISPVDLPIQSKKGPGGKIIYSVEGSPIQLSLQRESLRSSNMIFYNIKDLQISLDSTKSPKTYALLKQVLTENSGAVKMVSAGVRMDPKMIDQVQRANRKSIQSGPLQQTELGQLLLQHGFAGPVMMVAKEGRSPSGKAIHYLEMSFTRS